jgi:hypothetical protein
MLYRYNKSGIKQKYLSEEVKSSDDYQAFSDKSAVSGYLWMNYKTLMQRI